MHSESTWINCKGIYMEIVIKIIELIASVLSVCSAIISVVSSKKSKEKAREAQKLKEETEIIYNQYLQSMSKAAQSVERICENKIEQYSYDKIRSAIKQSIINLEEDCFDIEDIQNNLKNDFRIDISKNDILKILTDFERRRLIKSLSESKYHRFIK